MPGDLMIKGVTMVDAVDVLLANRARFEPHVPEDLRKYLDDPPYAGDWYAASEMTALCEAIRLGAFAHMDRQAAFEMMGETTVRRDLLGDEEVLLSDEAKARGGAYQGAIKPDMDFGKGTRRGLALWQLYYDQGELIAERSGERRLQIRLVGATSPSDEICWMNSGFIRAVVGSLGVSSTVEHTKCSAHGAEECVWSLTYGPEIEPSKLDSFGPQAPDDD